MIPDSAHLETAERLLFLEAAGDGPAAAAGRVYERLFDRLAPLIGSAGVRALFARSVRLTTAEHACLARAYIAVEPSEADAAPSRALVDCLDNAEPAIASEAAVALYAAFFRLMTEFIGERLVWQVLRRAFPGLDEGLPREKENE